MTPEELADLHPTVFHMTADGAWPSIRRHGLLSTRAILELCAMTGEEHHKLSTGRRVESIHLSAPDGSTFVLRDQKPLNIAKLRDCLIDMIAPEWLLMLNSKVFLWPTKRRCQDLLNARAYRNDWHTIIEIDTKQLLDGHLEDMTLTRINTGAVLYNPPARGAHSFVPIAEVDFDAWRSKRARRQAIAEVVVDQSLPDVEALAVGVYRARAEDWQSI